MTVPAVALLAYLTWLVGVPSRLLGVGAATEHLLGLQYRPEVLAWQSVWFLGVAVTAIGALPATSMGGSPAVGRTLVLSAVSVVAGGAVAAFAAVQALSAGPDSLQHRADLPPETCTRTMPRVCVPSEYDQALADLSRLSLPVIRAAEELVPAERIVAIHGVRTTAHRRGEVQTSVEMDPPYVLSLDVAYDVVATLAGCSPTEDSRSNGAAPRYLVRASSDRPATGPGASSPTRQQALDDLASVRRGCRS